jgi:thiamine-monophosphate kinase
MIDTSDGFLGDLGHICAESGVGAELIQEKIPVSGNLRETALALGRDPRDFFLGESDDYELVITCRPWQAESLCSFIAGQGSVPVTEVGRITGASGEMSLLLPDGRMRPLRPSSWDHFRPPGRTGGDPPAQPAPNAPQQKEGEEEAP